MKIDRDAQVFSIVPPSNKNILLNGIINFSITNKLSIKVTNSSNYISPEGYIYQCDSIIKYNDSSYWHSRENSNFGEWVQIEFQNMWIKPTAITIVDSVNIYRLRNWKVSTSKDEINWVTIKNHKNSKIFQEKSQREIFRCKSPPARFIRITQTGYHATDNDTIDTSFRLGKAEVFGYYSICNSKCQESIPQFSFFSCNNMRRSSSIHVLVMILILCY